MCPSGRHLAATSPEIRPAFDVLDADRDGRISRADLRSFMISSFPSSASDDLISSMISSADADRSGFVEFDEFERALPFGAASAGEVMEEAFRLMDRDGDGRVGFDDLKGYLGWAGMPAGDDDVREMICCGGCDESEGVGFDDLMRILALDSGRRGCC